jgi:hypothetical protein
MKKKVFIFISIALAALAVVPAINLKYRGVQKQEEKKWWSRSVLYNIDFALPLLSRSLYPMGISIDPEQVIIGKNGWLFLGDIHNKTITVKRHGVMDWNMELAEKIALATKSWEQWLKLKGVRLYQVMLAPDKDTIYPEFLPDWAQPAAISATDALLTNISQEIYLDTRPALKAAKSQFSEPLYYKTDSHWNQLGSWIAFNALLKKIAIFEDGLELLSEKYIRVKVESIGGCDLANILRMSGSLKDSRIHVKIVSERPIESDLYDFETERLLATGDTCNKIDSPHRSILVKSKQALNQKKVLWLIDSFGLSGIIPFMTATFTETLIINYLDVDPDQFARLVEIYKPDYVFITVGERIAFNKWFENPPPIIVTSGKPDEFMPVSSGVLSGINDMIKVDGLNSFRISGEDPYVAFVLSKPVRTLDTSQLVLEFTCGERKEPVQVQVFWRSASTVFSEANSVRFTTYPGITTITLSTLSSWTQAEKITDVRVDIDSNRACPGIAIKRLEFGKISAHQS